MAKQGSMVIVVLAIILACIVIVLFAVDLATRQCNNNGDCSANAYCGSDNECHEYPEQIVVQENNFVPAAIIFGIAIIIAAVIVRWKKNESV